MRKIKEINKKEENVKEKIKQLRKLENRTNKLIKSKDLLVKKISPKKSNLKLALITFLSLIKFGFMYIIAGALLALLILMPSFNFINEHKIKYIVICGLAFTSVFFFYLYLFVKIKRYFEFSNFHYEELKPVYGFIEFKMKKLNIENHDLFFGKIVDKDKKIFSRIASMEEILEIKNNIKSVKEKENFKEKVLHKNVLDKEENITYNLIIFMYDVLITYLVKEENSLKIEIENLKKEIGKASYSKKDLINDIFEIDLK